MTLRSLPPVVRFLVRTAAATILVVLAILNWRIHDPGRVETAIAQLRFLSESLEEDGADRMQAVFPEGYVFTWALYGMAWAQVARSLPPSDARRGEALEAARSAVAHVESEHARATFAANMAPAHGAFYASWSLYLRSVVLRAFGRDDPSLLDFGRYEQDCEEFAAALRACESPYLPSYPGAVWPADTGVGVAALAIGEPVLGYRHRSLIARWVESVRRRVDPGSGAIPHSAGALDGMPVGGPRGESLALLACVLADVDRTLAREQYDALRRDFVAYHWGVPGVREYPRGVEGRGDIDSGPVVLGFSGPATVVGAAAAIRNGDQDLATTLLSAIEGVGLPIEIAGRRRYAGGLLPVGDAFLAWARTVPPGDSNVRYVRLVPHAWRLPFHALSLVLGSAVLFAMVRVGRSGGATPARRRSAAGRV